MTIGAPREIKTQEYRVALTPAGVDSLVHAGHTVIVEDQAGRESGFLNSSYEAVAQADLVIGAVLIPGALAPHLVTEAMVRSMQPGSVIVDVSINQGGCVETIDHPTTHDDPIFIKHDVVHYAVANIPGAVPRTATMALTNATIPYVEALAKKGWRKALQDDPGLAKGINVLGGRVTYSGVAQAHGLDYSPLEKIL